MINDVVIEFTTPPTMEGIRWNIIVRRNGNNLRIIENADVGMLFPGANAVLLYSVYPTKEHLMEPNEIELSIRTAFIKGDTDDGTLPNLSQKIKESGMRNTTRVLIHSDDVVVFLNAILPAMARRGECRWAEILMSDNVIADHLSSGELFENWIYHHEITTAGLPTNQKKQGNQRLVSAR